MFVISGIIKVAVSINSLSLRLRLIKLTWPLIISDITKPHPVIVYYLLRLYLALLPRSL